VWVLSWFRGQKARPTVLGAKECALLRNEAQGCGLLSLCPWGLIEGLYRRHTTDSVVTPRGLIVPTLGVSFRAGRWKGRRARNGRTH
jgi:hypothetical protein